MTRISATRTFTLGNLYNRFYDIENGIKNEPESRFVDDVCRFIRDARTEGLGGTLMKAEKLLKMYEDFRSASFPEKKPACRERHNCTHSSLPKLSVNDIFTC